MRLKDSYHPYAAVTILFWALAFVFTRLAITYFSAYSLGVLRYVAASAALLIVAAVTRMKPPKRKDLPWFLLAGAAGFALYMVVFNQGTRSVSASTGSVILATTPILTAILARIFYREKLRAVQYAAIGVAFLGVVVLTVLRGGFTRDVGLLYMFASALLVAVYNLLQRRLTRTYTALRSTAISIFLGTLMLCPFLPGAVAQLRDAPPIQYFYILMLGVFSSAVAYCAWAKALSLAQNTSSVSNYMFVTPFVTTLLGLWIAGEPVELSTVAGGLLIIGGLLLFRFGDRLLDRLTARRSVPFTK
ncbi:MAG: DMT family transporter [Clostridiales bacterium]|nr:DMT family transporter [Clostridiales bacterium]